MMTRARRRDVLNARTIVGALVAAMILTGAVPASQAASDIFNVFRRSGTIEPGSPIVTLTVPGGRYAIFAKVNIEQDDTTSQVTVTCRLRAGNDLDLNVVRLQRSGEFSVDVQTIPLQLVQGFEPGSVNDIVLSCRFSKLESELLSLRFAKITAIRIDGTSCDKPSPADCVPVPGAPNDSDRR